MIKKTVTNREKILRVLRRRKTPISTKELAMKAGVPHSSARRELAALYDSFEVDREPNMKANSRYWRIGSMV